MGRLYKRRCITAAVVLFSVLNAVPAQAQTVGDATVRTADRAPELGAYLESDLGVLLLFGGVGLFGGATYGPLRAGLGFYRFESPYRALSGAPKGFDVRVDGIVAADVAWHPFSERMEGGYLRLIGQLKWQRVENLDNGARKVLDSALVGPELGWLFRMRKGLYLTPRVGSLYYAAPPQGKDNRPVDVGGREYDNPKHRTLDNYATLGIGYVFD